MVDVIVATLSVAALSAADPPIVESVDADSRGRIFIAVDAVLDAGTVNDQSVVVASPGPDERIGTDDDVEVDREVVFNFAEREIRIFAEVEPGRPYSILLDASVIRDTSGCLLDGEFNGPGEPSGDGEEGGDFQAFAQLPDGNPTVRFTTIEGDIEVEFFADETPLTVDNFFDYMNDGVYDETFFHRLVEDFVIQGGGFFANEDLENIPTNPPVQNEPGIPNTRGTIAMAKMANNPNSATNQWFFNLFDNPNLNTQNGGFTVFGEITTSDGLDVMDALAAFETVDASDQGSAFGELPVLDADAVTDDDGVVTVTPDDLLLITRIAALYTLTDTPFMTLTPEQTTTISAPGGVQVNLIGVDGDPPAEDAVAVKFGKNGKINRITLLDTPSGSPIGIQIAGASSVGSITDKRSHGGGLAFIVSNAPVGSIKLKDGPSGFPLNNVLMPDGAFLDPDLDGDGQTGDETAVFIEEGYLKKLSVKGDLSGDVIVLGGAGAIQVGGEAADADIVLGEPDVKNPTLKIKMGDVRRSSLIAPETVITGFKVGSWADSTSEMIEAEGVVKINVKGDFEVNFDIPPSGSAPAPLKSVKVGGDASGAWVFRGDVGKTAIGGDCRDWSFGAIGDMKAFSAGDMENANLGVFGELGKLTVGSWDFGVLDVQTLNVGVIDGDFNANINIQGASPLFDVRSFTVKGGIDGGDLFIGGGVEKFLVQGDAESFLLTVGPEAGLISFGEVSNGDVNAGGVVGTLKADRWIGGDISAGAVGHINITGDGSTPGDLDADLNINTLNKLTVANGGTLDGELIATIVGEILVSGDVDGWSMRLGNFFTRSIPVLDNMVVGGAVVDSELAARGVVLSFSAGAMENSHLVVGGPEGLDAFPDAPNQIDAQGRIGFIDVSPGVGGSDGFINSYIIAGEIGDAMIGGMNADAPAPFGIGAFQIDQLWLTGADSGFRLYNDPASSPEAIGSFELRVGFQAAP